MNSGMGGISVPRCSGRWLLVLVLLVTPVAVGPTSAAAAAEGCSVVDIQEGKCVFDSQAKGDGVEIGAWRRVFSGRGSGSGSKGIPELPDWNPNALVPDCPVYVDRVCVGEVPPGEPGTPGVTMSDVAHFLVSPEVQSMEPNGWMVVGLDTNFFATGGAHVREGELLGVPASVRFTPVAWHWDYGDGATRSSPTPGSPWARQGVKEFDATATSHIYTGRGTYTIRLMVDYVAEYRIDGGAWIWVPGSLRAPANELVATAGHVKTVLVEHDCIQDRSGPGC